MFVFVFDGVLLFRRLTGHQSVSLFQLPPRFTRLELWRIYSLTVPGQVPPVARSVGMADEGVEAGGPHGVLPFGYAACGQAP